MHLEPKSKCWHDRAQLHASKTGLHRGEHRAVNSWSASVLFCLCERRGAVLRVGPVKGKNRAPSAEPLGAIRKGIARYMCLHPVTAPCPVLLIPLFNAVKHRAAPSFLLLHCSQFTSASVPSKSLRTSSPFLSKVCGKTKKSWYYHVKHCSQSLCWLCITGQLASQEEF